MLDLVWGRNTFVFLVLLCRRYLENCSPKMLLSTDGLISIANAGDLTFISIREVHALTATDTRITDTPHSGFTHLASVVHWTGASKIIKCDRAFSSIQTRLHLQKRATYSEVI